MDMSTTNNRSSIHPSIRPSTRTCSQRKTVKELYSLEIPPILEKNMTYETTDRTAICPATHPAAVPREHRTRKKNVDHPTDRPTDRYPIFSVFFLCLKHSSFIIHSSYLLTMNNDWPPDSVPSKGTTHSVRGSVNKKKKDGKKVDTLFFGISVPITQRRTAPRWFCSPFGGREGSSSGSSKQVSKCQVSSVKRKRTGVVLRTCPSSLFPPPVQEDRSPVPYICQEVMYVTGGIRLFPPQNLPIHTTIMSTRSRMPFVSSRLVWSRLVVYR